MRVTVIGHSTVLIEAGDVRLITDPYFGGWGNPAYARVSQPAMRREEVPPVAAALLSHNHWDHTDRCFLRGLPATVPTPCPNRTVWLTRMQGARMPVGMVPWRDIEVGPFRVTAVPAAHLAPTIGFVVQHGECAVYFAGDTFCRGFMREIGQRWRLDAALMPVTTYRLPMTMNEREAVDAARLLAPKAVIPIHLGIQPRSPLLRTGQSPQGFAARVKEAGLDTEVVVLRDGECWEAGE